MLLLLLLLCRTWQPVLCSDAQAVAGQLRLLQLRGDGPDCCLVLLQCGGVWPHVRFCLLQVIQALLQGLQDLM